MENDPFLNPSSSLAARLSATRTASAGICAFSLFLFLLGELPESVEIFGGGVDDRSEGSQLAAIARCGYCLVSFSKAIEEARHWSEVPLLHGAPVTIGPSPFSMVKAASREQSSDPFFRRPC